LPHDGVFRLVAQGSLFAGFLAVWRGVRVSLKTWGGRGGWWRCRVLSVAWSCCCRVRSLPVLAGGIQKQTRPTLTMLLMFGAVIPEAHHQERTLPVRLTSWIIPHSATGANLLLALDGYFWKPVRQRLCTPGDGHE